MNTAIIMLACSDYEAMELSLYCHAAFLPKNVPFYILQNCRGTYDSERTLIAARRLENIFPEQIRVIDHIAPNNAYKAIQTLLNSDLFKDIDIILKVDDDAFPLTANWFEVLKANFLNEKSKHKNIAYITPLINNNCWGFKETIDVMGISEEYFRNVAHPHFVGPRGDLNNPARVIPSHKIDTGAHGTVWGNPHIARWLHERTTLDPDRYIQATKNLSITEIPSLERYSIGCIMFERKLWNEIDNGGSDDEAMMHGYCRSTRSRILCSRSVPFVHLAYYSQRQENRDIVSKARDIYSRRLNLKFPIGVHETRELEIEARLRWLETNKNIATNSYASVGLNLKKTFKGLSYLLFPYSRKRKIKRDNIFRALK